MRTVRHALGASTLVVLLSLGFSTTPQEAADPASASARCAGDGTFCLRRTATGRVCSVSETTASPVGADFKGPFKTKGEGVVEMCRSLDRSMEDPAKCWATAPEDICPTPVPNPPTIVEVRQR